MDLNKNVYLYNYNAQFHKNILIIVHIYNVFTPLVINLIDFNFL